MATAHASLGVTGLVHRGIAGIAGGLVGGVAFGVLMQVMGMIPMVAMLVGSDSAGIGWLVHLVISAGIGASFGLLLGAAAAGAARAIGLGAVYGIVWWVLGGLLIMPAWLGMPVFTFTTAAWMSLVGHLVYGLLLGATYALVRPRLSR
ncbi:MAG: hypothetical protein AB7V42_16915 [Thermoleophilia bacterium]